ncbi:MAG: hypothetical protein DRI24_24565, partial [Deltaproteobacteria bacterium]
CDGLNGTLDLRGRALYGADTNFPYGTLGGAMPAAGVSGVDGAHSHTGSVANDAGDHGHAGSSAAGVADHSHTTPAPAVAPRASINYIMYTGV